jgi:BirA family biotin operon repressor/biotin-[acetyl-CoA-carboxylase] ligase
VRGRGYRLEHALRLLDVAVLGEAESGWRCFVYDKIDSTNSAAVRLLASEGVKPFVVLAEQQTSGRGRRGRKWQSPFAENIYYSLAWPVVGGARQLQGLSLVVGLAVLSTLRVFGLMSAGLKWPNDILLNGKKLAGVLLELVGDLADVCHVVIGVGVNVNMLSDVGAIDQPWTSLALGTGQAVDRNAFVNELNRQLQKYLAKHQQYGFPAFMLEWQAYDLWLGRAVVLSTAAEVASGVASGVDETGALIMQIDGERCVFSGGEISLRLGHDS